MTVGVLHRGWRTAGITALGDLLSPTRITAAAIRLAVQIFLVVCLWRALYAHAVVSAGLTKTQAVTYAVLAVFAMRLRGTDRFSARDKVIDHINFGTIVYWYLRPLSPQRYYLLRELGDQLYGFTWALVGYASCLAAEVVSLPATLDEGVAFGLSLLLGQSLLYYLVLLTDQLCFWTVKNASAVAIVIFAQNLLSGGYAAIWYFPHWFQLVSRLLPFQYTMSVPLSFYIGRLPFNDLPINIAATAMWIVVLGALTRTLWRRAATRVISQGG